MGRVGRVGSGKDITKPIWDTSRNKLNLIKVKEKEVLRVVVDL